MTRPKSGVVTLSNWRPDEAHQSIAEYRLIAKLLKDLRPALDHKKIKSGVKEAEREAKDDKRAACRRSKPCCGGHRQLSAARGFSA